MRGRKHFDYGQQDLIIVVDVTSMCLNFQVFFVLRLQVRLFHHKHLCGVKREIQQDKSRVRESSQNIL